MILIENARRYLGGPGAKVVRQDAMFMEASVKDRSVSNGRTLSKRRWEWWDLFDRAVAEHAKRIQQPRKKDWQ